MLSDTEDAYTEEKLEIIRKTLPPMTTCTAETGPLNMDFPAYTWTKLHGFAVQSHETPVEMEDVNLKDAYDMAGIYPTMEDVHPFSTLWSFHYNHAGENWCVAGRFATVPLKESKICLEQLQLDSKEAYHVFDFWKEEYLGIVTGEVAVRELGLGECQILGLRKVKKEPQFLASTRHVSMDAVSVTNVTWADEQLQILFAGVPGTKEKYYFTVPNGYELKNIQGNGMWCEPVQKDNLLCAEVEFVQAEAKLCLGF